MKPHVTAEFHNGRMLVFGQPDPEDESHSCDALGCGSVGPHVLERLSPIEAAQELYRLRARVAELEAQYQAALDGWHAVSSSESAIALAVGVVEVDPEAGPIGPGDPSDVLAEVRRLVESEKGKRAERDQLRARVAELETPPVVPEGWTVELHYDGWHAHQSMTPLGWAPGRAQALRALAWAVEHDQRPPHAGDE